MTSAATQTPLAFGIPEPTAAAGIPTGPDAQRQHAVQLLREFSTVMLISFERHGHDAHGAPQSRCEPKLQARPMHVASVDDDGTLWFVTSIDSTKVEEALSPHDGYAVAQTKTRQASIRGTFTVVRDPDQIRDVWKKEYEVFFPDGPTDARVCILGLHPREIEFWDASGGNGLTYLIDAAKAFMAGETPKPRPEEHERVRLG